MRSSGTEVHPPVDMALHLHGSRYIYLPVRRVRLCCAVSVQSPRAGCTSDISRSALFCEFVPVRFLEKFAVAEYAKLLSHIETVAPPKERDGGEFECRVRSRLKTRLI